MTRSKNDRAAAAQKAEAERWGLTQRKLLCSKFDRIGHFTFGLIDAIGVDTNQTLLSRQGNVTDAMISRPVGYTNPDSQNTYDIRLGITSAHQSLRLPHLSPRTFLSVIAIVSSNDDAPRAMQLTVGEFARAFTMHHPTLPYQYPGNADTRGKIIQFAAITGLVEQLVVSRPVVESVAEPVAVGVQEQSADTLRSGIDMYL